MDANTKTPAAAETLTAARYCADVDADLSLIAGCRNPARAMKRAVNFPWQTVASIVAEVNEYEHQSNGRW